MLLLAYVALGVFMVLGFWLIQVFLVDRTLRHAEERHRLAADAEKRANELTFAAMRDGPNKALVALIDQHLSLNADLTKQALDAAMAWSEDFRLLRRQDIEASLAAAKYVDARTRFVGQARGRVPDSAKEPVRDGVHEQPNGTL